jgi:hypothetical protein
LWCALRHERQSERVDFYLDETTYDSRVYKACEMLSKAQNFIESHLNEIYFEIIVQYVTQRKINHAICGSLSQE